MKNQKKTNEYKKIQYIQKQYKKELSDVTIFKYIRFHVRGNIKAVKLDEETNTLKDGVRAVYDIHLLLNHPIPPAPLQALLDAIPNIVCVDSFVDE